MRRLCGAATHHITSEVDFVVQWIVVILLVSPVPSVIPMVHLALPELIPGVGGRNTK